MISYIIEMFMRSCRSLSVVVGSGVFVGQQRSSIVSHMKHWPVGWTDLLIPFVFVHFIQ